MNINEKSPSVFDAGTGLFAIFVTQNNQGGAMYYTLKDHQGSWTVITDSVGNVEQELSYDAWGNLRSPETWCVDTTIRPMFDRGYTGHEHLIGFRLINMNGRMYDPVMSSFLSVDRYVQQPETSQGFNRYAYCMYNPLKYVDPSGWMMTRPNGRGGIPPYFAPNAQPVSVNGGYQLSEIDGVLYGGCLRDVDVTAFAITSSGDMPSNHLSEWSSDRGFGNYGHIDGTLSNSEIKPYAGGSGLGAFWTGGYNTPTKSEGLSSSILSYPTAAVSTLLGASSYSYTRTQNRVALTELGKSLSKAQKAKLASKYPKLLPKGASAAKYGKAVARELEKTGKTLGYIGLGIEALDVLLSGEIHASNIYNGVIGAVCIFSGPVGWIIGGVALAGDIISCAYTGRTIGGNIDRLFDDKSCRLWDGVY